jgi:hypothetical protein
LRAGVHNPKLVVVGHRGCGKNKSLSKGEAIDSRPSIRENTIASFNQAARNGADYVEFDVQVNPQKTTPSMYNIPLHFVFLKSLTFLTFKGKVLFCNQ